MNLTDIRDLYRDKEAYYDKETWEWLFSQKKT